jgi:uncharacterized membrane protein
MGWLVACPFHYTGLIGLILFFVIFYFQPNIINRGEQQAYRITWSLCLIFFAYTIALTRYTIQLNRIFTDQEVFFKATYVIFLVCIWYAFSYLPFGRFFNRLGGNDSSLMTYAFLFIYLGGVSLRFPRLYNLFKASAYNG